MAQHRTAGVTFEPSAAVCPSLARPLRGSHLRSPRSGWLPKLPVRPYDDVIKDVTKPYPGGREVVEGLTLSFSPVVKIAALGNNGLLCDRLSNRHRPHFLAWRNGFPYETPVITSKLTSKAQTTIPIAVRTALGLKAGDELAYVIERGRVIIARRAAAIESEDPFVTFTEWTSEADAAAYAGF